MSYEKVKSLSIVERDDGWTFKITSASNNVAPLQWRAGESAERYATRDEVDFELCGLFWDGDFRDGQTAWRVRNDIARLLCREAGWQEDDCPDELLKSVVWPAARDLYAMWKQAAGKYAIVDDDGAFLERLQETQSRSLYKRSARPRYMSALEVGALACRLSFGDRSRAHRVVSEAEVANIERALSERGDWSMYPRAVAELVWGVARDLFHPGWLWCIERYPRLLSDDAGVVVR